MPVGNCFWIFPYLFSVALPGKTCAIYHSSFYWYKDIRCISCSSDWEVRSFQNRVFPTRNIEKSANSERRRLVDLNCKMNTEISPVKTSRNWDKERDQIEGRGTALCVSAICCLFFFFHAWSVWCTSFSDTHDSTWINALRITNGIGDRRPSHKGAWHGTGRLTSHGVWTS